MTLKAKSLRAIALHIILCSLFTALLSAHLPAQMVNPDMDRPGEPFSYFSRPTDVIGVMNAPSATEITPEGFLYTGYGELMFFTGPERTPLAARVRTLERGYLPIVHYGARNNGIDYTFTAFAAQIPHPQIDENAPTGQVANFVRVTVTNAGTKPRAAFFTAAIRYQGEQTTAQPQPDNRFRRPAQADKLGGYSQPGEAFQAGWSYRMAAGSCLRENRVLFRYPTDPDPHEQLTFNTHYNRILPTASNSLKLTPTTPVCTVEYTIVLQPHETHSLDLVMPLLPVPDDSSDAEALRSADFDTAHKGIVAYWTKLLNRGMRIELPESKPVEVFYASLVYDLLGRNIVNGRFIQTAGQFQYHRFYLRDNADYVRMYDRTGYPDIGGQTLSFFLDCQQPDGNFVSQPDQFDGWGEAMLTFGEHYRITHDRAFAEQVFPFMLRALDWLHQARAKDPLHLIPATDVRDNEYVAGHLTGYNFLALDGLDAGIEIARALNRTEALHRFEKEKSDYAATFFPLLDKVSAAQGGMLPPSLDAGAWKGTDWGNLLSITPQPLLDPWDPRVTATLHKVQSQYQEGISTYTEPDDGVFLHHYLTIKNTLTELVRGEQQQAVREFYAELLHTSSTHAGFEYAIRPWGTRDFEGNLAPHAWFAADYRNLLRDMLVREQGDTLHLLSAVSPEWIAPGKQIAVSEATTSFGRVAFTLKSITNDEALLTLNNNFTHAPSQILVHLPWFLVGREVSADGQLLHIENGVLRIPASAREVRIRWQFASHPVMSYRRAVESYKEEYRRRWEKLMDTGKAPITKDDWQVPE